VGAAKVRTTGRKGVSSLLLNLSSLITAKLPSLPLQPSLSPITFFSVCGPSAHASFDGSGLSAYSTRQHGRTLGVRFGQNQPGKVGKSPVEEHRDVRNGVDGRSDRFG
jgi:hypothetical protein